MGQELPVKEVLDVEDVQKYLGISKNSAYNLVSSGDLYAVKIGRRWKISRKVFLNWLNGENK
ncbi:helix-turn-helix domain-containing protein [Cytobacillus horneckiae]|uniref:DNA-binding protein n=1 Tax=Cytobacillus horneckiae TaxID=549687 RepID=A0A2N0ZF98_9BACI|nr:helix-turn-helix domain-containing protein [Cytobacillus horneckiae]MEC1155624.1 helix-turn-helix domain-containing protein [Cytobacillus horneckiae]MED2936943.1 helix-turn-helix domain-containing protein [Cytobacillus horneckiae]PKG28178.1 DNA-binding protein [Cytobacillus horneckiae]